MCNAIVFQLQIDPTNMLRLPILREVDLGVPEEYEAFKFYWEQGLSRVAGVKGWDDNDRHYTIISRARWPHGSGDDRMFNVSTEAFFQVLWENNYDRWCAQIEWLKVNKGKKLPKRNKENKDEPMFKGLYTNQDGGQQRMGGWSIQGIERFNEIYDLIVAAKYTDPDKPDDKSGIHPGWNLVETNFLARIRTELGIVAINAQQERNNRRRNNPGQEQPERRVRPRGF